jgi:hypothetical protein
MPHGGRNVSFLPFRAASRSAALSAFLTPLVLLVVTVAFGQSSAVLVDDFNDDVQNRLGGYRNTFQRAPSTARAIRVADVFRGRTGRSLQIKADRQEDGFCGLWIHFFDFRHPAPTYFDCRDYQYLSFWVKGAVGDEHVLVKLADRRWIEKEDALAVGEVEDFLPGGVTESWQEVLIPLSRIGPLDRRNLGGLIFEFTKVGKQVIYVDDVSFKTDRQSAVPPADGSKGAGAARKSYPRVLWVWSTDKLLAQRKDSRELLDFCRCWNVTQLWLQLPYSMESRELAPQASPTGGVVRGSCCVIRHPDQLRWFLREAHGLGIRVHALDGSPEYCLRANHHVPLGVVDAVIAFNGACTREERWDGVHFDNEPYLLIGWADRTHREQILREYLELNDQCQQRIRGRRPLVFGVDIPFWWQDVDAETGLANAEVQYGGKRKAASYHCLDRLDNVGVMNYRDTADGADGLIAHGRDLLAYADRAGGAEVYMGVETFAELPTEVRFIAGLPKDAFRAAIRQTGRELASASRWCGLRLRWIDDGRHIHVGLEAPQDRAKHTQQEVDEALEKIARSFGACRHPQYKHSADAILAHAQQALRKDPSLGHYRGGATDTFETKNGLRGFRTTSIMLPKITFADDSFEEFQTQLTAAEDYFRRYETYRGLAIHYYETFRAKTEDRRRGFDGS